MTLAEGEAAFYGPKLDLQVRDGRGHDETIATIQLDFSQPDRFSLTYQAADGSRQRVVMIHRGTVGSMERVVAALLERYQGRLPLWLAPVQLCVMPVSPAQDDAARDLLDYVRAAGLRGVLEVEGSLGARVRASRQRRDHVIAVVVEEEVVARCRSSTSRRYSGDQYLGAISSTCCPARTPTGWATWTGRET